MAGRSTPIFDGSLRRMLPKEIDDAGEIRTLLSRVRVAGLRLHRGLNAQTELETAWIEDVGPSELLLRTRNFEFSQGGGQLFLNFTFQDQPYFFVTRRTASLGGDEFRVEIPGTIFHGERRDRSRRVPDRGAGDPQRVEVEDGQGRALLASVQDISASGMSVLLEADSVPEPPFRIRFLDGEESGRELDFELQNHRPADGHRGWTRLGLTHAGSGRLDRIQVDDFSEILGTPEGAASAPATSQEESRPTLVRIADDRGEEIVALADSWGKAGPATAVVITNGWGQTKEALLPLARSVVASFREAGESIVVLRYDGIRRRGESHNDPECRVPGRESRHFVLSQAVRDLEAVIAYLRDRSKQRVSKLVVVSFSASAIEARKAVARDRGRRIDGWVSVVGSPDLQSMSRSISGGVDFVAGHELGVEFGFQELLGITLDIDRVAVDAKEYQMSFLEDSMRDFEEIDIPITWYHGRHDGWVDLSRVEKVLSRGRTDQRRLVVLPTGHQLKNSRQAQDTFRCIASEVGRMALGRQVKPVNAAVAEVRRRRIAEGRRVPPLETDLRAFWSDYLLGRDRSLGIELLTSSGAYRSLMAAQLAGLELAGGERIVDLGSGTGAFALALANWPERPRSLRVIEFDFVHEALLRARSRLTSGRCTKSLDIVYSEANLDLQRPGDGIPIADRSVDAMLASLLLSYLEFPTLVLDDCHRILRPGGRLVVSSLCRDADISKLYVEAYSELHEGVRDFDLPELRDTDFATVARSFLNDAAKILELEDAGGFHFWDPEELAELVSARGFEVVDTIRSLGNPPQAVVVSARRL